MDGRGNALTYDSGSWSAPTHVGPGLTAISCVSASFCAAVGGSGEVAVFREGNWGEPTAISGLGALNSVSCVSEDFCAAVNYDGYVVYYDGSSWSTPEQIDTKWNPYLHSVSCVSASFCVAVGNSGDELTYNGTTWSAPNAIGHSGTIASVSCHSTSYCVATSSDEAMTYNGSAWTVSYPSGAQLGGDASVSCPSDSFCEVAGPGPRAISDNAGAWSPQTRIGGGLSSISCSSADFCAALDRNGRALTFSGGAWGVPSRIDAYRFGAAVSCPSSSFCMATGDEAQGYALSYNGSSWGVPAEIDSGDWVRALSCPSSETCMAVANHTVEGEERGFALIYQAGVWGAPVEINAEGPLESVSCASASFCVAVGGHLVFTYDGINWSPPRQIDPEGRLQGVSCPSSGFCAAVSVHYGVASTYGFELIYHHGIWEQATKIGLGPGRGQSDVDSVSCSSAVFCVAVSPDGEVSSYNGTAWSAWSPLEFNGQFLSVSCPSASFCEVVNAPGQVFTYSDPSAGAPTEGSEGASRGGGGMPEGEGKPGSPLQLPVVELGKPRVSRRTGEIEVRFRLSTPGDIKVVGELVSSRRGAESSLTHYSGPHKPSLQSAGIHQIRIDPSPAVRKALERGATLAVRVKLIFSQPELGSRSYYAPIVRVRLIRPNRWNSRLRSRDHAAT